MAWHIAALERQKKLPKLKSLMHGAKPKRRQTVDEQVAIAMAWTRALSGPRRAG